MGINLYHGYIPIALHGASHWLGPIFQLADICQLDICRITCKISPPTWAAVTVSEQIYMAATSASFEELEHTHPCQPLISTSEDKCKIASAEMATILFGLF
jgi:hypothetical protein